MKIGAGGLSVQAAQVIKPVLNDEKYDKEKKLFSVEQTKGTGTDTVKEQYNLIKALEQFANSYDPGSYHYRFKVHDETGRLMFQVLDNEGRIKKEIPPEETLELLSRIQRAVGLVFDQYI